MSDDGMIIVGASLAGAKAAEGARTQGWTKPIRLIGTERSRPYERPPMTKGVLAGRLDESVALVHGDSFYVDHDIDLLLGETATTLDLAERSVSLASGGSFRFAKVVLATGSSPRRLGIPGANLPEVVTLRTLEETLALRQLLRGGRRLGVVGASWIGTECAASARELGCEVVMVDPLATPLERALGPEVGAFFAELHRQHGVDLRLGSGVQAIHGTDHVEAMQVTDGTMLAVDVVVAGIGVSPNIDLARRAGLAVGGGVLVDAELRSSHPDVYAAGDIAEAEHPALGHRVRVEHWANALHQGLVAGANAAGGREVFDRVPYFFSDQYDTSMEYSGWPLPWTRVVLRHGPNDGAFTALYVDGARVVGGATFNSPGINVHVQGLVRSNSLYNLDALADVDVVPERWVDHRLSETGRRSGEAQRRR